MRHGLLGEKLGHSFSPQIHAMLGCPDYGLIELPRAELDGFMRRRDFDAINVTIPYKRDVMPYCAELDPAAEAIGCVNTIINKEGRLFGYNTDFSGFLYMADRAGGKGPWAGGQHFGGRGHRPGGYPELRRRGVPRDPLYVCWPDAGCRQPAGKV